VAALHGPVLAVDAQAPGALLQRAAAGALGLVAHQEDEVLGPAQPPRQVVQDASPGHHAAAGDDDHGPLAGVQLLGLVHRAAQVDVAREQTAAAVLDEVVVQVRVVEMAAVDQRGVHGHGAVHEDGHLGQFALPHEVAQDQGDHLHAAHGEGRHQHNALAADGLAEHAADLVGHRLVVVVAVAVRGLDDQHVARGHGLGITVQRHAETAHVTAEDDGLLAVARGHAHLDERRAQDVSALAEARAHALAQVQPLVVVAGLQALERRQRVHAGVERLGRTVLAVALLVGPRRVFLLQMGRIHEHELEQFAGGPGGVHGRLHPQLHRPRQPAGVIDVGVGQQHVVDRAQVEGRRLPVAQAQFLQALEQAAVHEDAALARLQQVAGTGDAACGAVERQSHATSPLAAANNGEAAGAVSWSR
jgi:hypothetical protein